MSNTSLQLMTSLETNVLVTTIKTLEKITHSSPGYCPLKGDVTKIDDFL